MCNYNYLEKNVKKKKHSSNDARFYPVSSAGKKAPVKRKLVMEIQQIFEQNIDKCANGKNKRVGHLTMEKRKTVMMGFIADLHHLGFQIESMSNLREKHIVAWVELLVNNGQKPATIQNKLSVLRIYCSWIGKYGMVRSPEYYVTDASLVKRVTATRIDRSWDSKDVSNLIKIVSQKDPNVGVQLETCKEFGLRRLEAIMFKPHIADEGTYLHVRAGTKGGRPRMIPITTEQQRRLLDKAKAMADPKSGLICRPGMTLKQAINRFKYVMRYCCLTRAGEGVTAHGLRHGYVHRRYQERTGGGKLPVKGGKPGDVDPMMDKVAKLKIMEEVGHSRLSVSTAYGGSFGHVGRSNKPHYAPITQEQSEAICAVLESLEKFGLAGPSGEDKSAAPI